MGDERIDVTYLPVMAEIMPSLSDTLLRNGGPYDARVIHEKAAQWAEKNPGLPLVMDSNNVSEVSFLFRLTKVPRVNKLQIMQVATVNTTLSLDIEYKRRLPRDGMRFTFTRATAKTLLDGRMDVDLTICNEDMDVVCLARQLMLALGMHRKFGGEAKQPEPKL